MRRYPTPLSSRANAIFQCQTSPQLEIQNGRESPFEAAEILRSAGHDAHSVQEESLSGAPDDRLFDICRSEERCLVTLDLDFADIRNYSPDIHFGVSLSGSSTWTNRMFLAG